MHSSFGQLSSSDSAWEVRKCISSLCTEHSSAPFAKDEFGLSSNMWLMEPQESQVAMMAFVREESCAAVSFLVLRRLGITEFCSLVIQWFGENPF